MQTNSLMKDGLVGGIIFLVVASSINVVKASDDDSLIEMTSQACGIQGYGTTKVTLTKEQHQNLDQYFIEFRTRLNQTATREGTLSVFKEAIRELATYGLLPKGMSVEQAQDLVVGQNQDYKAIELFSNFLPGTTRMFDSSNFLCAISGSGTNMQILGLFTGARHLLVILTIMGLEGVYELLTGHHLPFIRNISGWNAEIGGRVAFGYVDSSNWERPTIVPAEGWVTTHGFFGAKAWSGSFSGKIRDGIGLIYPLTQQPCIGATGFVGLRIGHWTHWDGTFFGTALRVKISN